MESFESERITPVKQLGESKYSTVYKCKYNSYICAYKKYQTREVNKEIRNKMIININNEIRNLPTNRNIFHFIGTCISKLGDIYILSEFVFGSCLKSLIEENQLCEFDWQLKGRISYGVALAIEFLHNNNIVHRNIKSSNIVLDFDDKYNPKLRDFLDHEILDGLYWKAPEISCKKFSSGSKKSDIYGFGIVLYEIITSLTIKGEKFYFQDSLFEEKSQECPSILKSVCEQSISTDAYKRPSAPELTSSLLLFKSNDDHNDNELLTPQSSAFNSNEPTFLKITEGNLINVQHLAIDYFDKKLYVEAMNNFDLPAWGGDPISQYYLGKGYLFGLGRTKNSDLALKWLDISSSNGHLKSVFLLIQMHFYGFGVKLDISYVINHLTIMAKKSHLNSMALLAHCYEFGIGVDKNYNLAIDIYTTLSKGLHKISNYKLAQHYSNKILLKQDLLSFKYYKICADMESYLAYFALGEAWEYGKGTRVSYKESFEYYRKAAEKDYPPALLMIAKFYDKGICTKVDHMMAFKYYLLAAERGVKDIEYLIGRRLEKGVGVKKDMEQAVFWYKRAAKNGDGLALNNLGRCYQLGNGIEIDFEKAFACYKKSAKKGIFQGLINMGTCYRHGIGVIEDYRFAYYYYKEANKLTPYNPIALYRLAKCYESGIGVDMNLEFASSLYSQASELGYSKAIIRLKHLTEILDSKIEFVKSSPHPIAPAQEWGSFSGLSSLLDQDNCSPILYISPRDCSFKDVESIKKEENKNKCKSKWKDFKTCFLKFF